MFPVVVGGVYTGRNVMGAPESNSRSKVESPAAVPAGRNVHGHAPFTRSAQAPIPRHAPATREARTIQGVRQVIQRVSQGNSLHVISITDDNGE